VTDARFTQEGGLLSFSPERAAVLNIGSSDNALIIDIGIDASAEVQAFHTENSALHPEPVRENNALHSEPPRSGDDEFLAECRRLFMNPNLVKMGTEMLQEVRKHHPGKLVEGKARKWVNHPGNFVALTIQNRDQSFAIHVKGRSSEFAAPTLDIRPDRGSYCRFKLEHERQLQDAIKVILASAARSEGY
jgi:hypothetical protein